MLTDTDNIANKRAVWSCMNAIAESDGAQLDARLRQIYHPDAQWRGSHPWNELQGVDAIRAGFWAPLLESFPDLERRHAIVMGGEYQDRVYVGLVGHLTGSFRRDWLGLPATDQVIHLRVGEFHQMVDGRIVQSTVLLDVLDAIRQAGFWPLPPSLGQEGLWAGPFSGDGLLFTPQAAAESSASLKLTLNMQATLGAYDDTLGGGREGLLTMPQQQFWHPKMMWYGPSGIGTARSLAGFVDCHQWPFRAAFPNAPDSPSSVERRRDGKSHYVRIGDGRYSATAGWPSRFVDHLGGGWLGLGATDRAVTMRVMDFYLADAGRIRENWVPIDLLDLLLQMDVDVLARVRTQWGRRAPL